MKTNSETTFHYDFDDMFDYYKNGDGENENEMNMDLNGDLVFYSYEILSKSKKVKTQNRRDIEGEIETFLHIGATNIRRLVDLERYYPKENSAYGIFLVVVGRAMYFVTPIMKENEIFADHLSFVIDKNDRKKSLHLHHTMYFPNSIAPSQGMCYGQPLYLPSSFECPTRVSNFSQKYIQPKYDGYAKYVFPVIAYPFFEEEQREFLLDTSGGGKRQASTSSSSSQKAKQTAKKKERPRNKEFSNLWLNQPLASLVAIGIRQLDQTYIFSVFCKLKPLEDDEEEGNNYEATMFKVANRGVARNERVIQAKIANILKDHIFRDEDRLIDTSIGADIQSKAV